MPYTYNNIYKIKIEMSRAKREAKFKLLLPKQQSNKSEPIIIAFEDEYLLPTIDKSFFEFPNNILQDFSIQFSIKKISLHSINKHSSFDQCDEKNIEVLFKNIWVFHLRATEAQKYYKFFKRNLREFHKHTILGVKKFHIETGRYEQGDLLIYKKGSSIIEFLNQLDNYFEQEEFLYELDSLYQMNKISIDSDKKALSKIISHENSSLIKVASEKLGLKVLQIQPRLNQRKPMFSIALSIEGNRQNIHLLYIQIQKELSTQLITLLQDQQQLQIPISHINKLNDQYPQYKIFKISESSIAVLSKVRDNQQFDSIKRKIKLRDWIIDSDYEFSSQQFKILHKQHMNNQLKMYMVNRSIFWEEINVSESEIKITCDRTTKNKFVEQCRNLLKTFVKVSNLCEKFNTVLLVEVFKKYYMKNLQNQFMVQFQFGQDHIIRTNYSKYSSDIEQQLNIIRDKIQKKTIKLVSRKSIKSIENINNKFFTQISKPKGYERSLLGCCLYQMGNSNIKLKKIQSLKRQEESIIYLIDNRLCEGSLFHKIIQKNKLNYNLFLSQAQRTKKPQRIMQYITDYCAYTYKTILLHAGPVGKSQTLRRDIERIFCPKMIFGLFKHDVDFLWDVFSIALQVIKEQATNLVLNRDSNISVSNLNRSKVQIQFYYEGGQEAFKNIERVMKQSNLKIRPLSTFCIDWFDIQKIYALQYSSLKLKTSNKQLAPSPIFAQLLDYELRRGLKRDDKKKRCIFSIFQHSVRQLVQFVISLKTKIYYKITHDQGKKSWSQRPHIEAFQQLDPQLQKIVSIIEKYFQRQDYLILSAEAISDGLHGRKISYCTNYYMAQQDRNQLTSVSIDISQSKIVSNQNDNSRAFLQYKESQMDYWCDIEGYQEELDQIRQFYDI